MYEVPEFVEYDNPVRPAGETRAGQGFTGAFFRALCQAVRGSAPRLTEITTGTPADGQLVTGAATDATNGQVNLAAPALPAGSVIGYERSDGITANTVVITMTPSAGGTATTHTLRFKGQQIVLVSRGDGTYAKVANWLPFDGLKALFDTLYAAGGVVPVVDQGTVTSGAHTPSLATSQKATFTTNAPTIATPAVAGQTPADGQRVYGRYLASSSLLFTLGGSPSRSQSYPATLQVPAGKRVRIVWEYSTLGTAGWTVLLFAVEQ